MTTTPETGSTPRRGVHPTLLLPHPAHGLSEDPLLRLALGRQTQNRPARHPRRAQRAAARTRSRQDPRRAHPRAHRHRHHPVPQLRQRPPAQHRHRDPARARPAPMSPTLLHRPSSQTALRCRRNRCVFEPCGTPHRLRLQPPSEPCAHPSVPATGLPGLHCSAASEPRHAQLGEKRAPNPHSGLPIPRGSVQHVLSRMLLDSVYLLTQTCYARSTRDKTLFVSRRRARLAALGIKRYSFES